MHKKTQLYWIIGLLCPIVGLVLYLMWFKKYKDKANNVLIGTIFGFILYGIMIATSVLSKSKYEDRDINEWMSDINSGKEVVTIFGASYCSHCQEYKPVIIKMAKANNINLYFYEIDTKTEEERNTLLNTYELENYDGSVPYTFIYKDKKFVKDDVGFADEATTYTFLKENGIIKD